jgi:phytoene desaturase
MKMSAHHTVMMGPRYGGLLHDIFDAKVLADDFSLYLYRPTATDPSMAPEGCDTFYVLSPVPNLDAGIDWATAAEPYRRRIEAHLEATTAARPWPARGVIAADDSGRFPRPPALGQGCCLRHGAGDHPACLVPPPQQERGGGKPVLVGAGTHPGAGLPGVVSSAKILDKVVPHASAVV